MITDIHAIPETYLHPCERAGRLEKLSIPGHSDALAYLPFGYDESNAAYDVFYLLHGGGGEPASFFAEDQLLRYQLDHMIANGDIKPMIVIAPTYYPPNFTEKTPERSDVVAKGFSKLLRDKIVPTVDSKYRTNPVRSSRAIGGFSMGSVTTWYAFVEALDLFQWFMPLSGDCWVFGKLGGSLHAQETAQLLANTARGKSFYIHALTGTKDIAEPNLSAQIEAMRAHSDVFRFGDNIRYSIMQDGDHDYPFMRRFIYHALPEFF